MVSSEELVSNYIHAWLKRDVVAAANCLHPDFKYWETIAGGMYKTAFFRYLQTWFGSSNEMLFTYDFFDAGENIAYIQYQSYFRYPGTGRQVKINVLAEICCQDNLIISQKDYINLYDFSKQAYGIWGWLFGWTLFMHKMLARQMRYTVWLANPKMDPINPKFKRIFPKSHPIYLANAKR